VFIGFSSVSMMLLAAMLVVVGMKWFGPVSAWERFLPG
jgi:hypothetical protein